MVETVGHRLLQLGDARPGVLLGFGDAQCRVRSVDATLRITSCIWTGIRMTAPSSAMARVIDCLIHHIAYVENLLPVVGSNLHAARINPSTPCWNRSSYFSPCSRYRRTKECTSVRKMCGEPLRCRRRHERTVDAMTVSRQ